MIGQGAISSGQVDMSSISLASVIFGTISTYLDLS